MDSLGHFGQNKKKCFSFLWGGSYDKRMMPWVRWDQWALLKALGSWGLKNIFVFSKALAAKSGWHLISMNSLWTDVIWHKYIASSSIMDWIQSSSQGGREISYIWKTVLDALDVIRLGLTWNTGRGDHFRIGWDLWPGCGVDHILPPALVDCLEQAYVLFLSQVGNPWMLTIHQQGCMSGDALGLDVDLCRIWDNYLGALWREQIWISDTEDSLVWMLSTNGIYRTKEGCIALCADRFVIDPKWWWRGLWKLQYPAKLNSFGGRYWKTRSLHGTFYRRYPLLDLATAASTILKWKLFNIYSWIVGWKKTSGHTFFIYSKLDWNGKGDQWMRPFHFGGTLLVINPCV